MKAPDDGSREALEVARELVGGAVELSRLLARGRNSRIWRVRSGSHVFALKQYPPQGEDPRNRLSTEVGALRLMQQNRIDTVPRVIVTDERRGYALLSWIDGRDIMDVGGSEIDAGIAFLVAIHALRGVPEAVKQPLAAEACLSGREIVRQIEMRLTRLREAAAADAGLIDFISESFAPVFAERGRWAEARMAAAKLDFNAELPQEWRTLVPSDFGFHNSLRRGDGSLAFLDFEYFGWDDPVKLAADFMLHPGRTLPAAQRERFRREAVRVYGGDPGFARRLGAYLPLFGLRWVLILLNEFLPERWKHRVLAGETESWTVAKERQLERARVLLSSIAGSQEI